MWPFDRRKSKQPDIEIKEATSILSTPEAFLIDLFAGTPVAAGVSVTPQTAMRCTPVRCAVQSIAEALGQLPVHIYARGENGAKERAPDHPVAALFRDEASAFVSASDFREQLTRDALLHGNGVAFINTSDGVPVELNRLDPASVKVEANSFGEPVYRQTPSRGAPIVYSATQIFHLKGPSLDGLSGDSPIAQAREAIGLALAMELHAATFFGNGARPSGVLSFDSTLTAEALKRRREAWQASHGGRKSGGVAALDGNAKYQPIIMNSTDAQFIENRRFAIEEIARIFRVPPMMLMDYGRATWANSEEMGRQFLTYTLLPWIKRWEGEFRLKLIPAEQRQLYFAEFLADDLLRGDNAARMSSYATAIAARVLSPNEARAAENRPPYPGGDVFANPNTTTNITTPENPE